MFKICQIYYLQVLNLCLYVTVLVFFFSLSYQKNDNFKLCLKRKGGFIYIKLGHDIKQEQMFVLGIIYFLRNIRENTQKLHVP